MQVRPNRTVVQGKVCAIRPEADGGGAELEIRVERNESPQLEDDFLRPAAGSMLRAFLAEPGGLHVGQNIRAEAHLNADARGGRVVLREVRKVDE